MAPACSRPRKVSCARHRRRCPGVSAGRTRGWSTSTRPAGARPDSCARPPPPLRADPRWAVRPVLGAPPRRRRSPRPASYRLPRLTAPPPAVRTFSSRSESPPPLSTPRGFCVASAERPGRVARAALGAGVLTSCSAPGRDRSQEAAARRTPWSARRLPVAPRPGAVSAGAGGRSPRSACPPRLHRHRRGLRRAADAHRSPGHRDARRSGRAPGRCPRERPNASATRADRRRSSRPDPCRVSARAWHGAGHRDVVGWRHHHGRRLRGRSSSGLAARRRRHLVPGVNRRPRWADRTPDLGLAGPVGLDSRRVGE